VSGPPWHFDDNGEVLGRFLAVSFRLLFGDASGTRCYEVNGWKNYSVAFRNRLRPLEFRGMGHVRENDVKCSASERRFQIRGRRNRTNGMACLAKC
jgi:hypothetical protein